MRCLQSFNCSAKLGATLLSSLAITSFTLVPFAQPAVAFPVIVDAKDNCISVDPSQYPGGSPVWITGVTERYCLLSITENTSHWYPGSPNFGEVMLHFERVAAVGGVPVDIEGSSPVDLYQATLETDGQILIEFQSHSSGGYLGHFAAFVSDSGNQDNSGSITIEVTPLDPATTDPRVHTEDLISMQVRPSVGSGQGMTLSFQSPDPLDDCNVGIFDANGRLVADVPLRDAGHEVALDGLGLRSGVYFANLISRDGVLAHGKFTIVR